MNAKTTNTDGHAKRKIFIASISATFFDPRVVAERTDGDVFICRLKDDVDSAEEILVTLAHRPLLLLWFTEDAAREDAMRTAKKYLREDAGFTNHAVVLTEISRANFLDAQTAEIFIRLTSCFRWLLRLAGFAD